MTHRQYEAWVAWRCRCDVQMGPPSLTDWQLMRVAQRVQQVLAKSPNDISLEHQRVEFAWPIPRPEPPVDPEKVTRWSQARWMPMAKKAPGYRMVKGGDVSRIKDRKDPLSVAMVKAVEIKARARGQTRTNEPGGHAPEGKDDADG